ncbi:uncharacterized protein LOC116346115 [Contarinia nasturtii]|uniref:uncharacterized protein LOC116346115 n=1 Tax=Contarinia nasturtii TaxID=265458 RepID=UPI0012D4B62C|nr:uncharacterized protein LOC116346115 [Contarinia nasturtii]
MKLMSALLLIYFALASEKIACDIIKAEAVAFRWPVATARCPDGTKLLGGGGNCESVVAGIGWVFIAGSHPVNNIEWTVRCDTPQSQNVRAQSFAICSKSERY